MPAPIAPWMSASEAFTIWMLSTAMNAPSAEPMTAIHVLSGTALSAACAPGARETVGDATGLLFTGTAMALMVFPSLPPRCGGRPAAITWEIPNGLSRPAERSVGAAGAGLTRLRPGRHVARRRRTASLGHLRRLGIDGGLHRHAGPQQSVELGVVERDLDRDALDDLGEIAGGVVGWQQGKLQSTGRRQAVHAPRQLDAR